MQNPPPGQQQQGYGSPYGSPPNAPMTPTPGGGGGPKDKTALGGLEANVVAALGYPIGVIALIEVIIEKENRFARFHAMQSLLLIAGWIVVIIALSILLGILSMMSSTLGLLAGLFMPLLGLLFLAAMIFCAYKAYNGEKFKLPVVGNIAENFTSK